MGYHTARGPGVVIGKVVLFLPSLYRTGSISYIRIPILSGKPLERFWVRSEPNEREVAE